MGSKGHANNIPSPRGAKADGGCASENGGGSGKSPKGQLCLCSPTTHQGSFRCKFHRQGSTTVAWFNRSKSMPPARNNNTNGGSKNQTIEQWSKNMRRIRYLCCTICNTTVANPSSH
ncbi:hypothetical protein M8C21_017202 [Ambrosia artemisiifolia]|uniref:Uncharacterized protein n=1 Tax=Ambrosia artemisiifolia TaxID=4212 RepID=A0AAD5CG03_AMBAR|nr:hypothetical protein M8C21_017202 [Ambrosia artemisiifolia]